MGCWREGESSLSCLEFFHWTELIPPLPPSAARRPDRGAQLVRLDTAGAQRSDGPHHQSPRQDRRGAREGERTSQLGLHSLAE
jgi:hypothetical protein